VIAPVIGDGLDGGGFAIRRPQPDGDVSGLPPARRRSVSD